MNKRLKANWVRALRSGKYTQGKETLVQEADGTKSFCCLGVLRDIDPTILKDLDGCELLEPGSCGIPAKVQSALAVFNDAGKSFKWIASNIERRKTL